VLEVNPKLELSTSAELLLPLRWIAILYGRIPVYFTLTIGVHYGEDMVKAVMAGARAVLVASELVEKGIPRAKILLDEFSYWMDEHEYPSVHQMLGVMSQQKVQEPAAFERANYMKALTRFDHRLP